MSLIEMIEKTNRTHKSFIEGNYHISDPLLILERRAMMDESNLESGIAINPRIEASPRYEQTLPLLGQGLPKEVDDILDEFIKEHLDVFDTPYTHQLEALKEFFVNGKDIVVMTGTGSGKTEIFLWAILGHLAQESSRGSTTQLRGIRSMMLYPMNALVSDQLGRIRKLIGLHNPKGARSGSEILQSIFTRIPQFMQYTSRAPYHGNYNAQKNKDRLQPLFETWRDLSNATPGTTQHDLYTRLHDKGRIPAKDIQGFINSNYWTTNGDPELFARHEARDPANQHGGVPDILITNYAMLEFMLLRPIEDPFWNETASWLGEPDSQLLMVLDEAHLYRGAVGAEVAMLLRRFMLRLGIDNTNRNKVRFILTSASFTNPTAACDFASQLTGKQSSDFVAIPPTAAAAFPSITGNVDDTDVRLLSQLESVPSSTDPALTNWMNHRSWPTRGTGIGIQEHLGANIINDSLAMEAARFLESRPNRISTLEEFTEYIFPEINHSTSQSERTSAALNLVNLLSVATSQGNNILPLRLHMMLRSLDKHFICVNPDCDQRRVIPGQDPRATTEHLGRLSVGIPVGGSCGCGSKMFELLTHRDCGASYLKVFVDEKSFKWPPAPPYQLPVVPYNSKQEGLKECVLLVSEVSSHTVWNGVQTHNKMRCFLEKSNGVMHYNLPAGRQPSDFLSVLVPEGGAVKLPLGGGGVNKPISSSTDRRSTWYFCPHCTKKNTGLSNSLHGRIQDLQVKGTQPFTNLLSVIFTEQPAQPNNNNPNEGRKMIAFSDSRQKAAKLSIDMQNHTETDRFREFYLRSYDRLVKPRPGNENNLGISFCSFLEHIQSQNIDFFDRQAREEIILRKETKLITQPSIGVNPIDNTLKQLTFRAPSEFYGTLLTMFGHDNFSMRKLNAGYVKFTETISQAFDTQLTPYIPDSNNRSAILEQIVNEAMKTFSLCHIESVVDPFGPQDAIHFVPENRSYNPCKIARSWWKLDDMDEFITNANSNVNQILSNANDVGVIPNQADIPTIIGIIQQAMRTHVIENVPRYLINIKTLQLVDSTTHTDWYRCDACKEVSPFSYSTASGNVCVECSSPLINTVTPMDVCLDYGNGDLHLQSRNRHYLRPALLAITNADTIRTLRTEEHSAQISGKDDDDEQYAKTEIYEMLFQDIPIGSDTQPVDILSCTTTMEVGIDIGGITAVALRTIPPRPDNYQQRAGRAGRRGTSLSTIISYANNTPHDIHHFRNPEEIIGLSADDPVIYVTNTVIAERHISASLIELFINQIGPLPVQGGLVNAWGTYAEFFVTTPIHASWNAPQIINFLTALIPTPGTLSTVAQDLISCLPSQMFPTSSGLNISQWIELQINELRDWIDERLPGKPLHMDSDLQSIGLMEYLLNEMKLPKFAFPLKTVNFQAEEYRHNFTNNRSIQLAYNPSTDGAAALTMYAPERMLTIDKHRMLSKGVTFSNQRPSIHNRARRRLNQIHYNAQNPPPQYSPPVVEYLNSCNYCFTVSTIRNQDLHGTACTACSTGNLQSLRYLEPEGFAPEHGQRNNTPALRNNTNNQSGLGYSTVARNKLQKFTMAESRYPLETNLSGIQVTPILSNHSLMYPRENQNLLVVNDGEEHAGFEICLDCGSINPQANHWRPYVRRRSPNIPLHGQFPFQPSKCASIDKENFALAHSIDSSVLVIQTRMGDPLNVFAGTETPWFNSACESLVEAIRLTAARALGIESKELKGGWRFVPQAAFGGGVAPVGATNFNLELYFHDTLPGGAGFSSRLEQYAPSGTWGIPDVARNLLDCNQNCSTSCTECLRTPDNQMIHESLNRHWALQLLEYIVLETRPQISSVSRQNHVNELKEIFALFNNGNTFVDNHIAGDEYEFEFNGNTERFHIQSVLATQIDPDTTITDLDMATQISNVIQKIRAAL
jgi:Lhr-like helicase